MISRQSLWSKGYYRFKEVVEQSRLEIREKSITLQRLYVLQQAMQSAAMLSTLAKDVLLFAGQGSNNYMSDADSVDKLEAELGAGSSTWDVISTRCLKVFRAEYGSMPTEDQLHIGLDVEDIFKTPRSLLLPPRSVQCHPIVETVALYIRQVMELLIYTLHNDRRQRKILATAGVCTGMLPAVISLAAPSQNRDGFIESITEGFRLAFWIGVRSALWCSQASGHNKSWEETSRVLSVFGVPVAQATSLLSLDEITNLPSLEPAPRISSILSDDSFSISGFHQQLDRIEASLTSRSIRCRRAQVHGFYHGGENFKELVHQVSNDVGRRKISFPTWESLLAPLCSTTTGLYMKQMPGSQTLLEATLSHIFVDTVNWKAAQRSLSLSAKDPENKSLSTGTRIVCIGPGSGSLARHSLDLWPGSGLSVISDFPQSLSGPDGDDIAIVGLSSNFPCGKGLEQLWDALQNGLSTAAEIPHSRFKIEGRTGGTYGNFLQDTFDFDPAYFNISPREAKSVDPQQRLLLRAALEALEDAGYSSDATPTFQRATFGVYVGVATGDYVDNLRNDIDVYYSPGTLRAFLSGRISYVFGFKGPSVVIDTACSSSTVALYQACRAIQAGDCTAALAGGVNSISSPDMYTGLSRGHFLSSTGQCKPFDAAADGYCRSEGCGLVVLKKLSRALEEKDEIYGVIRGIEVNQSGMAISITHPDHETQASLFRRTLDSANVSANSISLIEAHGTGTQAGDAAEVSSIASAFGIRPPDNPLFISSIKGNIGHAEAASGVAGLMKVLVSMKKKQIPLQASHNRLNPRLEKVKSHNFIIPKSTEPWNTARNRNPRRAMLNNFGAAGSNAAVLIEEHIPQCCHRYPRPTKALPRRSQHILNISAKSPKALETLRGKYMHHIATNPDLLVEDVCYTANARRLQHAHYRLSVVGSDLAQLASRLQEAKIRPRAPTGTMRAPIFVFSGQGSSHAGMGGELYYTAPVFRDAVAKCDDILSLSGFPTVTTYISQRSQPPRSKEEECVVMQCATFVLEYALAQLWMSWGVQPHMVLGHSIGEYAALVIAQMLDLQEAMMFVARRAVLMTTKCKANATGMLACKIPTEHTLGEFENAIHEHVDVEIACRNGPQDFVVAGPVTALDAIGEYFKSRNIKTKRLQVPYGFHSSGMNPILDDLTNLASSLSFRSPSQIKYGSALYGRCLAADEVLDSKYLVQHTRDPVNFAGLVANLRSCSLPLLIVEAGPSGSTRSMFPSATSDDKFISSISPSESAWVSMTSALQNLYLEGQDVNWRNVYEGLPVRFLRSLPGYPLSMSQYLVPFSNSPITTVAETAAIPEKPAYAFVVPQPVAHGDISTCRQFTTALTRVSPLIKAHAVGGVPLCPASVYIEMVLEALSLSGRMKATERVPILENITFEHPFVYSETDENTQLDLTTTLEFEASEDASFSCKTRSARNHCSGGFTRQTQEVNDAFFTRKRSYIERQRRSFLSDPSGLLETFSTRTIYQHIFTRVVKYGEPFQTLKSLTVRSGGLEGYGTFQLPTSALNKRFVCSPALIDTLLHTSGFMANAYVSLDTACICVKVEKAIIPCLPTESITGEMSVYSSLLDVGNSVIADAYALESSGRVMMSIEGMHFRKVRLASFSAQLSKLAQRAVNVFPVVREASSAGPTHNKPTGTIEEDPELSMNDIETILYSIVSETCGVELDAEPDRPLLELGIDSLLQIELTETICRRFSPMAVRKSDLENCTTLTELTIIVVDAVKQKGHRQSTPPPNLMIDNGSPSGYTTEAATPPSEDPKRQTLEWQTELDNMLSDLCGLSLTGDEKSTSLGSLGVDSLLSIEIVQEIQSRFDINLDENEASPFLSDLSYLHLEKLLGQKMMEFSAQKCRSPLDGKDSDVNSSARSISDLIPKESCAKMLQCQQHGERKSPLYLFHDGSGLATMYSRISALNRDTYGISSPEFWSPEATFQKDCQVNTLEELATLYIQSMNLSAQRDIILGGWSFGGVLAFEVSRQLRQFGKAPKGVILIDSPPPVNHRALPAEVISYISDKSPPKAFTQTESSRKAHFKLSRQFEHHSALLEEYAPMSGSDDVPCVVLRCTRIVDTEALCAVRYPWLSDETVRTQFVNEWERLIGQDVACFDINCNHFEVFEEQNVGGLSRLLKQACEAIERAS